jgi:hypothetical protein
MNRLRVLGGFALDGPTGPALRLPKRRAEAVLAVLAVSGDLGCSRERLLALVWPESDDPAPRHALHDAPDFDPLCGAPGYRALVARHAGAGAADTAGLP